MWIKKKNRPISTVFSIGLSAFELVKLSGHRIPRIREHLLFIFLFYLSFPATLLFCIPPFLNPSFPESLLSWISPFLNPYFPESLISLHPIFPALLVSCIPLVLYPSCPIQYTSLLSWIPLVLRPSCPEFLLFYGPPVLHSCCIPPAETKMFDNKASISNWFDIVTKQKRSTM